MYAPPEFRENDAEQMNDLIVRSSFGVLVSHDSNGLAATHLPMLLDVENGRAVRLVSHMARGNAQWRGIQAGSEVLAIFTSADAYITPRWYSAEPDVPTWNYQAVHVRGTFRLMEDAADVRRLLARTVDRYEQASARPWSLAKLDESLIKRLQRGVACFTIDIVEMTAASKLSQDKTIEDREHVIAGLESRGGARDLEIGKAMRRSAYGEGDG